MTADMAAIADHNLTDIGNWSHSTDDNNSYISLDSHQTTPVAYLNSENQIRDL
jgi:hypothetical protein